jgi:HEAT repeat protein
VRQAGLETLSSCGALGGAKAEQWLLKLLEDADPGLRVSAVKAVGEARVKKAAPHLVRLLADDGRPPAERRAALHALAVLDEASARGLAEKLLGAGSTALQAEAVQVLGARPEGAKRAARLFLDGKLPRGLREPVAEALRQHAGKDAEAAALLSAVRKAGPRPSR